MDQGAARAERGTGPADRAPALGDLDLVQRAVGDPSVPGHTLLLGPAGTGKTAALLHAVACGAAHGGVDSVIGLTSTRSAARQWQAALARLGDGLQPAVFTVAGLARRVLGGVEPGDDQTEQPRILTAPEQESRIREILAGTVGSGSVDWPAEWKPALSTRSFARQLRRVVAHVRRTGWDPDRLQAVAGARGDGLWVAVGQFLEEYLQVLDWEGSIDHAEVVLRAVRRLESGLPGPFGSVTTVVADDLHDADPMQVRLLLAAGAPGSRVVAAADPDQAVASYRGGDLGALDVLRRAGARVLVAATAYRGGARMRDARARLMGSRWYACLPAAPALSYRQPIVVRESPDTVEAVEFDDATAQARHLADRLWREHRAGRPWLDMAVLASSPSAEIPALARGLAQARIPVRVPAGDLALAEQPAVAALLRAAELVLSDDWLTVGADPVWRALAVSGMAGATELTARQVRSLAAWLTRTAQDPDGAVLGALQRDPSLAAMVPAELEEPANAVVGLGRRLASARRRHERGAPPAEVLWDLWHGVGPDAGEWPDRLIRRMQRPGEAAVSAGRQLDAVLQLFRLAERAPERWGGRRGLRALVDELDHQEIPAEPDLKQQSHGDAVEILSVHRALGREWPLVVATGLTESAWRGSPFAGGPLTPGRLTEDDLLPVAPTQDSAERRRLFATVLGRASDTLILAACGGPDDPPTPFVQAASVAVNRVAGPPATPRTPLDVLLRLRHAARSGTPAQQQHAVAALRVLVSEGARRGASSVALAGLSPYRWAGAADWTVAAEPLRRPDRPLALSGSALASLAACPRRWLLQREARADRPAGTQARLGLVVHDAAAALLREPRDADPNLAALIDERWQPAGYDAHWQQLLERDRAIEALERAHRWLATRRAELRAEVPVDELVPVLDERGHVVDHVRIRGSVDLVETGPDGAVVWDYKTRKTPASGQEVLENVQLAAYQGVLQAAGGPPVTAAGLVQLCVPASAADPGSPKVRQQPAVTGNDAPGQWASSVLRSAAQAVRTEEFPAQPGPGCRSCPFQASCPAQSRECGA